MQLNWTAAAAPLVSVIVFITGFIVQFGWTRGSAKALAGYTAVNDDGSPRPDHEVRASERHIFDRLSFDADRAQLLATIAVVPPSLLVVFDFPWEMAPFMVASCILLIVASIAVLENATPDGNRLLKHKSGQPRNTGPLSLISKTTVVTAGALLVYFLAVLLFTPLELTHGFSPIPSPSMSPPTR